ncbi:hypothetical protein [Chryseobacterium oncorhynchi]|uniref:Uncharacterized protein n=1 Tax=Chryseobacterium oncorhynchi TaxID=741074 RepID=A0A316WNC7_9FLAO|nr:hypothetical protein [Chryseobacterium oncorhynchi]PWN60050.1 hypothetical protein C1638_021010 [Chryseobacterium oncorhynchi]
MTTKLFLSGLVLSIFLIGCSDRTDENLIPTPEPQKKVEKTFSQQKIELNKTEASRVAGDSLKSYQENLNGYTNKELTSGPGQEQETVDPTKGDRP